MEDDMRYTIATWLISPLITFSTAAAEEKTVTLRIENMTCVACPYIVEKTLAAVPGVQQIKVSYENKTATVTFDDSQTDVSALTAATTNAGYPSQPITTSGG
jgi:periplasmic mercuric ion binding protein